MAWRRRFTPPRRTSSSRNSASRSAPVSMPRMRSASLESYAAAQNVSTDLLLTKLAAVDPNDLVVLDTIAARHNGSRNYPKLDRHYLRTRRSGQDIVNQVAIGHLTPAAALQIIRITALQLVQHRPGRACSRPCCPGISRRKSCSAICSIWTEQDNSLAPISPISGRLSLANNLAAIPERAERSVQCRHRHRPGRSLPWSHSVGQALAITALQTGAQLITPANINKSRCGAGPNHPGADDRCPDEQHLHRMRRSRWRASAPPD